LRFAALIGFIRQSTAFLSLFIFCIWAVCDKKSEMETIVVMV